MVTFNIFDKIEQILDEYDLTFDTYTTSKSIFEKELYDEWEKAINDLFENLEEELNKKHSKNKDKDKDKDKNEDKNRTDCTSSKKPNVSGECNTQNTSILKQKADNSINTLLSENNSDNATNSNTHPNTGTSNTNNNSTQNIEMLEKEIDKIIKRLYKKIAVKSHPDKINDKEKNLLFIKANFFYKNKILVGIIYVAKKLQVKVDITQFKEIIIIYILREIGKIQEKIKSMKSSIYLKWKNENNENKHKIKEEYAKINKLKKKDKKVNVSL